MNDKKIVRINLNSMKHRIDLIQDGYLNLGGRGLGSNIISDEVPPESDPLGENNKLVIAAGLLAGTPIPDSSRFSIVSKSPVSSTIEEANTGNSAAQKLAGTGIQAVVLEGIACRETVIKITGNGICFVKPEETISTTGSEYIATLKKEHGSDICILCTDHNGERILPVYAISVISPDSPVSVVAKGGYGSVMKAKNVRAVIIDDRGCSPLQISDKELFKKKLATFIQESQGIFKETASIYRERLPVPVNANPTALENYIAALDTLGLPLLSYLTVAGKPEVRKMLIACVSAVIDEPLDQDYLERLGRMVLDTEKKFNSSARAGKMEYNNR